MTFSNDPFDENDIIEMESHNSWADSIYFFDWDKRAITGHMTPKPKTGDYISCLMESGRRAVFRVTDLKCYESPKDQFFGHVEDVGYIDELKPQET